MIERSAIKSKAKQQLKGKLFLSIGVLLLAQALTNLDLFNPKLYNLEITHESTIFTAFRILSFLLSGVMSVSTARYCLNLINNAEDARFSDIFSGFSVYIKTVGLYILSTVAIFIGTLALIVPGMIVSLMFSQAYYILCEDNDKSIIQCLRESTEMMKGHKWELFVLQLSFLGWMLLALLTLGLAIIWVQPYMQVTFANYYVELKSISGKNGLY